jgi:hypothetical protein
MIDKSVNIQRKIKNLNSNHSRENQIKSFYKGLYQLTSIRLKTQKDSKLGITFTSITSARGKAKTK